MLIKNLQDALLQVITPLPTAGNNVTSNSFDLLGGDPTKVSNELVPERIELQISIPSLPANESTSDSVSATFVDSADGVTFAPIAGLSAVTIPGVASTGTAADVVNVRPPPTTRRYVAVQYAATSGAGNNSGVSATFSLVF